MGLDLASYGLLLNVVHCYYLLDACSGNLTELLAGPVEARDRAWVHEAIALKAFFEVVTVPDHVYILAVAQVPNLDRTSGRGQKFHLQLLRTPNQFSRWVIMCEASLYLQLASMSDACIFLLPILLHSQNGNDVFSEQRHASNCDSHIVCLRSPEVGKRETENRVRKF